MPRENLRRWVEAQRAVERRQSEAHGEDGSDGESAIASGLALIALAGRLHGWPIAGDEADRRDEALARARWNRLRAALGSHGGTV